MDNTAHACASAGEGGTMDSAEHGCVDPAASITGAGGLIGMSPGTMGAAVFCGATPLGSEKPDRLGIEAPGIFGANIPGNDVGAPGGARGADGGARGCKPGGNVIPMGNCMAINSAI